MNYKEELNNIALELRRQSDLILSPKAHQTNSLLHVLVQCFNSNKVKIAEYNARLNVIQHYNTPDTDKEVYLEAMKDYMFTSLCIDNIVKENEQLQNQIDKILKLYE